MKIIFARTGKFSFDPLRGPVQNCIKAEEADIDEEHAAQLIESGWAIRLEDEIQYFWQHPDFDPDALDSKDRLKRFTRDRFGVDLDKRKSVQNMIKAIREIIENDR